MEKLPSTREANNGLDGNRLSTKAIKIDLILAGAEDIPFCVRLAQLKSNHLRPLLVFINTSGHAATFSEVSREGTYFVKSKELVEIVPNNTYFFGATHTLRRINQQFLLTNSIGPSSQFLDILEYSLQRRDVSICDLLVLRPARSHHRIAFWDYDIECQWLESDSHNPVEHRENRLYLSRPRMMAKLCFQYAHNPERVEHSGSTPLASNKTDFEYFSQTILSRLEKHTNRGFDQFTPDWLYKTLRKRAATIATKPTISDYLKIFQNSSVERNNFEQLLRRSEPQFQRKSLVERITHLTMKPLTRLGHKSIRILIAESGTGETVAGVALAKYHHEQENFCKLQISAVVSEEFAPNLEKVNLEWQQWQANSPHGNEQLNFNTLRESSVRSGAIETPSATFDFHHGPITRLDSQRPFQLIFCHVPLQHIRQAKRLEYFLHLNRRLATGGFLYLEHTSESQINFLCKSMGFSVFPTCHNLLRKAGPAKIDETGPGLYTASAEEAHFAPTLETLLANYQHASDTD